MHVLDTIAAFRAARRALGSAALGFVPTMGYLHAGHLSLIEHAARENDVAVSIFVNPTQFGPAEDFNRYPRDPERDLALLGAAGVALVFMPTVAEMYPPGAQTTVEVSGVSQGLEGAHRPGHFRGVATVVAKLFNIVMPDRAYFGQKDAQQVAVIRRMVADLNFPLEVVTVPTARAEDGLALSSRNVFLTHEQRAVAPILYRALQTAAEHAANGERNGTNLRKIMRDVLAREPSAQVEYVSAADADTLHELNPEPNPELTLKHDPAHNTSPGTAILLSLAVQIGATRLIDNVLCG